MSTIIAPSVLAANFANLGKDIEMINGSVAEWIHIDVMDGVFVPNISFGFPVLEAIRKNTQKFCDVHLMIVQPERYFKQFKEAGADGLSIHVEGNNQLHHDIMAIQALGMKASAVVNPGTPIEALSDVVHMLDYVLIMSVNPGYGGQAFIPESVEKVAALKQMIMEKEAKALIEVDGGVGPANAAALREAGADILVAGSSVFKAADPASMIQQLRDC